MPNKLDEMMRKITALLAKADHPNTGEAEADVFRAKAESLMAKYRIEEADLMATGGASANGIAPVSREVPLCPVESPFYMTYLQIMGQVLAHCGIRGANEGTRVDEQGIAQWVINMVGFESDLRYAEALYQSARMVFAERMEPKPRADLSEVDNVYFMRKAGMERIRIAKLMGYGDTNSATAKVTNMFKRACRERGEDPSTLLGRSNSVKVYREQYANGFTSQLWRNLHNARVTAEQDVKGGALVLANRKEVVDEAFYRLYPWARPSDTPATGRSTRRYRWTAADQRRWEQANSAAGQAGMRAGRRAADDVQVNKGTAPKKIK